MKITIIADDNTGATDAAGMLTSCGAKAVLLMNRDTADLSILKSGFDVVVLGTGIRSAAPDTAWEKTRNAVSAAYRNSDLIQLKYCSTFDSTTEGNIGQSIDAARTVINFPSTPVCPALPVNRRTTYMGYHFVGNKLLSESSMKNHPLNPMTDSNLVRWLSLQTDTPVGLVSYNEIIQGKDSVLQRRKQLEEEGIIYHVADALCQENIDTVTESYADTGFLTGGSGISSSIGNLFFRGEKTCNEDPRLRKLGNKTLIVSGSDSETTQKQKKRALSAGFTVISVSPYEILENTASLEQVSAEAEQVYRRGGNVILTVASSGINSSENVKLKGQKMGLSAEKTGEKISLFLGQAADIITENLDIDRLVAAGGETSGAVCRECRIEALEVCRQIDPGVPYCFPLGKSRPMVVLKSGNFGAEDLFLKTADLNS